MSIHVIHNLTFMGKIMLKIKSITTLLAFAAVSSAMLASGAQAAAPAGTAAGYGNSVAADTYGRQITISPQTKWVNVTDGETVKFDVNGKTFAWNVDTFSNDTVFDLAKIAPAGIEVNNVRVYVAPNPLYFN
ncbi:hypothetical protein D9O50_10440 [Oxalobacteraceae bacterium CAVE-383]|nr:hypothetical protein D9O50_10440 [Oxalobacteraceae bacterium CAVE-383]